MKTVSPNKRSEESIEHIARHGVEHKKVEGVCFNKENACLHGQEEKTNIIFWGNPTSEGFLLS